MIHMLLLPLLIISGSIALIGLVGRIAASINGYDDAIWLSIFWAALTICIFTVIFGVHNVGDNKIRLLHRDREPFVILKSGVHYMPVWDVFQRSTIDCSTRTNTFPSSENIGWVDIGQKTSKFQIKGKSEWNPVCEPENALAAYRITEKNKTDNVIEERLFYSHVSDLIGKAIVECQPASDESATVLDIEDYYRNTGRECALERIRENPESVVSVTDLTQWIVRHR